MRAEVIESELSFTAGLFNMLSVSALYSHPSADVEKGLPQLTKMYYNAVSSIPYMTQGRTGDDMLKAERMKAVNEFKKMRDDMTKKLVPKLQVKER